MADSFVEVTEGSGKTVDTRTEGTNGNHRQVIIIGDPAANAGVAPVDATYGLAVDVIRSALPSGAATSAKQDTIIGHIDNVEGLLTTIDADTGNISTKVDTIAGAVSGTEMQVDVVGSLPAGSNAIGKLAANSGIDIGDVDVTSVIPGTGATNLGKAIDTATGATDTGVLALATRDDALSTLTPAEGDNVQLRTTSTGALWVTQSGTVTVDGSGVTQPVSNAGLTELAAAINSSKLDVNIVSSDVASGGTSAADDADFTATTTTGTPAMGVYESTPTNVTDGDMGIVGITTGRRLKTSSTIDVALPAGTNNIGDVDVLSSALPTGASTLAEQQSQTTHLATIAGDTTDIEAAVELIDDTVTTLGTTTYTEGSSKGLTIGAVRRDADTTLVDTTNEFGPLQMDANGRLKVEAFSGEALPVTLTSTTVTGTVAVTQSGTWDEVGINDSGNSITVDNNGTFVTQVDGAALTALQLIDDVVYTDDTSTHSTGTSKGVGMMAVAVPTDTSISANDIGMIAMSTDRRQLSDVTLQVADTDVSITNPVPTKGVPSDIDINEIPPSDTATSGSTMIELDANPTIGDYNMTDSSSLGIATTDTISLIQVMSRMREETSGATNYTLRIKSAAAGTVSSSSSLDVGSTTVLTNPSGTTAFGNVHISYTDPTTAAAWTPTGTNSIDNMQVGVGTTDGNPDTWCLWLGAYIEYVPVAIAIDTTANSGVKASVSNYSFDIGVANQSNKAVGILVSCRDNDNPTNRPVTGITVGGNAATYVGGISSTDGDGDDIRTEGWIYPAPSNGVQTVSVTHTGTVDHAGAVAIALYNADQSTTVNATGTDEDTQSSATTHPDTTVTTTSVNCRVFDAVYHQDGADLTVGSEQKAIVQLGTNGGGDRSSFSSKLATASGATHMQWTAGTMDAFCQFAMAIGSYSAAGGTSVKDIIGTGFIPFAR